MEILFALSGIEIQKMAVETGMEIYVAHTDDLLEKNVLIEFNEATVRGSKETAIYAISCDKERSYTFVLYFAADYMRPLLVYPIVSNAVAFIKSCKKETIFVDLVEIASSSFTSDDDDMQGSDQEWIYSGNSWKFNTAMRFIKEHKASGGR